MVGTRQLARLVNHATERDVKVVLVGDPRQLPEIDAGGVLGGLASRVPVLTLTENRRQREPWERAALKQFRSGSVDQALDAFDKHGRIERHVTMTDVRARIVDAWADATRAGEQAIMLAARRDDVHALNQLARTALADRLSGPAMIIDGAVFQAGDTVMTLRNNARLDVRNGERGTLVSIDTRARSMTVRTTDRTVTLPATYLEAGHVSHGYAMTVHKAQGITVDRSFVLGTDDLYREMGYVAMSRGRHGDHLYIVAEPTREIEPLHGSSVERTNEENLAAALSTSKAQTMATDRINPHAGLDDRTLVGQWRDACAYVASIPLDQSGFIETGRREVVRLERRLAAVARELATRRSLRDTLARRDDRGDDTRNRLERITNDLQTTRRDQNGYVALGSERDEKLRKRPNAAAERDSLNDEIDRRVAERVEIHLASPAEYIEDRIGKRPDTGPKLKSWTNGTRQIERYRIEHDITDPAYALGQHDEPWRLATTLDDIHHQVEPPERSRAMRR